MLGCSTTSRANDSMTRRKHWRISIVGIREITRSKTSPMGFQRQIAFTTRKIEKCSGRYLRDAEQKRGEIR